MAQQVSPSSLAALAGVGGIVLSNPLAIAGFGPLGPVAGSAAAIWQASIGNVVAGSLFATLQSWGMTGGFLIPGIGWIMAGLSVGAFLLAQMA